MQSTVDNILDRLKGGFDLGVITSFSGFRVSILSFEKLPNFLTRTNYGLYTFNFTKEIEFIGMCGSNDSFIVSIYFKLDSTDKTKIRVRNYSLYQCEEIQLELPDYFYVYRTSLSGDFSVSFIDDETLMCYTSNKTKLDFVKGDETYTLLGSGNFTKGVGR